MGYYHGQIINLPATPPPDVTESPVKAIHIAYKTGHRDARHAAAELAIQADQRIEELERGNLAAQRVGLVLEGYRRMDEPIHEAVKRMLEELKAARAGKEVERIAR